MGYRSPDSPLFRHTVGSLEAGAHIDYAANIGFAGIQNVFACTKSISEQHLFGDRVQFRHLETGCMLYASLDVIRRPCLSPRYGWAQEEFLGHIQNAVAVALRIRSRHIAILVAAAPEIAHGVQLRLLAEYLKRAAEIAARADVHLGLEPLTSPALPTMVLRSLEDTVDVINLVGHPNVGLIFDTAHVQANETDAASRLAAVYGLVDVVQLADYPGRLEPGTGEVNFSAVLRELIRRDFSGLVELEHGWSQAGEEGERRGLDGLRQLDVSARRGMEPDHAAG